ncbi:MAG: hypothetical protein HY258_09755 [Chloroflexi bacterium]|nr:hypothetical protein [Chloroflexota bacterium]
MQLKPRHFAIILLLLATAALHFYAAFYVVEIKPDLLFTLNGLGYLGLLGAYFLPIPFFQQRHKLVWRVLFGYVILTIVAWAFITLLRFINHTEVSDLDRMTGYAAKTVEVILLGFLWSDKP